MPARTAQPPTAELAEELLVAHRGTAFFARALQQLRDDSLVAPSWLPGWSRAHLVAHVAYNARALSRLVEWARTGIEQPMYASVAQRAEEIELGATLSPAALRHLFDHSAVHLSVEWRDLSAERWEHPVRTVQGRTIPVAETVWLRTREVWLHALDLGGRARAADVPAPVWRRLLDDVVGAWRRRGDGARIALEFGDQRIEVQPGADIIVRGSLGEVALWAAGRPVRGLSWSTGAPVPPPVWI